MKLKKIGISLISVTAAALLLASCANAPSPEKEVNKNVASVNGLWEEVDSSTGKPSDKIKGNLVFENFKNGSTQKIHGNDGCNNIMGSATVKDTKVEFTELASTMMFCEGVETVLSQANTATFTKDTMTVKDKDGKTISTLKKSSKTVTPKESDNSNGDQDASVSNENTDIVIDGNGDLNGDSDASVQKDTADMTVEELESSGYIANEPFEMKSDSVQGDVSPEGSEFGPGASTI